MDYFAELQKAQSQFDEMYNLYKQMEKFADDYKKQRDNAFREIESLKSQVALLKDINQTLTKLN